MDHYVTTTREDPSRTCQGQQCALIHLEHARMYTVVSRACLAGADGCSDSVEDATWTKPTRTVLTLQVLPEKLILNDSLLLSS